MTSLFDSVVYAAQKARIAALEEQIDGLVAEVEYWKSEWAKATDERGRDTEIIQARAERDEWKERAMASPCKCGSHELPEHNDQCEYGRILRELEQAVEWVAYWRIEWMAARLAEGKLLDMNAPQDVDRLLEENEKLRRDLAEAARRSWE